MVAGSIHAGAGGLCLPRISTHDAATTTSGMTSVTSGKAATRPASGKLQRATTTARLPPTSIEVAVTATPRIRVLTNTSR
ncbi:hypothetical protein [Bordetella bronchiseptica]|uniref:hypothetical protein n=1 Tax=Bordetella bronchiseptica TaxID=518 RepID=UPI00137B4A20|nr:hypothetical protein [Bordetella bronchiseptica]